jgi:hypothetical protein
VRMCVRAASENLFPLDEEVAGPGWPRRVGRLVRSVGMTHLCVVWLMQVVRDDENGGRGKKEPV